MLASVFRHELEEAHRRGSAEVLVLTACSCSVDLVVNGGSTLSRYLRYEMKHARAVVQAFQIPLLMILWVILQHAREG